MRSDRLSPPVRAGLLIAACLLGLVAVFPLWKISLWAPQYPEGLSLYIWSDRISGDLQTINTLNHYIGMAAIHPESFSELKYFGPVFYLLMALGIGAAALGRVQGLYAWTAGLLGFALWALVDFWLWEYKFGHELNPDAAIKMEDMVYQPPLIGEKTFLNIVATSWPAIAGVAFAAVVIGALAASIVVFARRRPKGYA